jgi:hypothetical protein
VVSLPGNYEVLHVEISFARSRTNTQHGCWKLRHTHEFMDQLKHNGYHNVIATNSVD